MATRRHRKQWLASILVAIALASAWILAAYLPARRDAIARVSTGSHMAQTACGPIEYAIVGTAPATLVIHGAGGGFDQGVAFARELRGGGIAPSRFGYLRTPLPADAGAAAQADAHACLLDALHIRKAAVIGISAGAPSAIEFALRHPGRTTALVLLVPASYAPRPGDAPPVKTPRGTRLLFDTALRSDFLMWAAGKVAYEEMVRSILATPPQVLARAAPAEQARARALLDSILPVSRRRLGLLNDAQVTSTLRRHELEAITAPTLAISVADDLFGTFDAARYSAGRIPGARFVGFEHGGHVWIGHHAEVVGEIDRFLEANP